MDSKNIKWLKEITDNDIQEVGYKAARLAELSRANFPIPRAFVIGNKFYFSFLQTNNLKEKINLLLETIDYTNKKDLEKKSIEIKKIFLNNQFTDDFKAELGKAYIKIGEQKVGWLNSKVDEFVSIRLSITSEEISPKDLDFIEQFSGFINIKGIENIYKSVKGCWASLYSPEVLEYIKDNNLQINKIGYAIVIQKMINASKSGIIITTKEMQDKKSTVIEVIYGIGGKSLISEITPEHYEINKKNYSIIKKTKSKQEWMIRRLTGKTTKINLEPSTLDKNKLDLRYVKELTEIGNKLELYFGTPLYIDWVIGKADIHLISADPLDPNLKKLKIKKKKDASLQDKMDSYKKEVLLEGIPICQGVVNGIIKVINKPEDLKDITENHILVTKMTTLEMTPYLKIAKGIITDAGSSICHAALISKKYDIPCVVHTDYATKLLKNGDSVQLNGGAGIVYKLTGVKLVIRDDSKNNLNKKEEIKLLRKEPEFPETITKIIIDLKDLDDLKDINLNEVDGFLITVNSLFKEEELNEIIKDNSIFINKIKCKLKLFSEKLNKEIIYYKINLHNSNLLSKNTSSYEIETLLEINNPKINIVLENLKSSDEITPIKEVTDNNLCVTIETIKETLIEEYISRGIDSLIFNLEKIDSLELKRAFEICKENKITRILKVNNHSQEIIKELIELKVNSLIIDYKNLQIKETIYKKERELLKNLLSI